MKRQWPGHFPPTTRATPPGHLESPFRRLADSPFRCIPPAVGQRSTSLANEPMDHFSKKTNSLVAGGPVDILRGSSRSRCPTRERVEQRSSGLFLEENSKVLIRCPVVQTTKGGGAICDTPRRYQERTEDVEFIHLINLSITALGSVNTNLAGSRKMCRVLVAQADPTNIESLLGRASNGARTVGEFHFFLRELIESL